MIVFVTLDRMVWTLLDSLHLTTAVYPIERRVIWAWFRHVSHVFLQMFKFLFLLPSVTLDRMVWTLIDSLHLMTAVYPIERTCRMGVVPTRESCVSANVQISISITLCNFGQDGLDTLRFTTPHDSSLPHRKACHMGVVPSRESCVSANVQISISITLCNFGQDGLDTNRFTTLTTAVYPIERRVIWAWLRHVSHVFLQKFKFLFLLPSVTLDRMVWTLLDSLHLMTAVYPIERRVIWAWLRQITQHLATQELGTCIYLRLFGMFTNPEFLEL